VFYKFTLKLFDVQEGTIEWQDEKEIRKTSKPLTEGPHHATQNHPHTALAVLAATALTWGLQRTPSRVARRPASP
jgi:hypothetical protein